MSEITTVSINDIKLRVKDVNAIEMMAFITLYSRAVAENNFSALESSYDQLLGWVEAELNGEWVKLYDRQTKKCMVLALKNEFAKPNFIMKLMPIIQPFITRSAE